MDVLEVDAASNRGIDEIRDLREKVQFVPAQGRMKVYIIDEVHMLTTEAFNALLKMLEEPPSHVVFVLATTEPHKVLPTILSRCQRFDFRRILAPDVAERLKQVASAESISIDDAAVALVAKHAHGSLRDALGVLEQISSFSGKHVKVDDVTSLLGTIDIDSLFEIVDVIFEKDSSAILYFVQRLVDSGRDLRQFVKDLIEHLRNLFIIQNTETYEEIIDVTKETLSRYQAQANHFQSFQIMRYIDILSAVYNNMRFGAEARLLLEMALIKIVRSEVDISLEGLLYRIEKLENKFVPQTGKETTAVYETDVKEKKSLRKKENPISPDRGVDFQKIKRAWTVILEQVKKKKISTYALLLECKPTGVLDNSIFLEFNECSEFHKGEIEKPANMELVKSAIKEIIGIKMDVVCLVSDGTNKDLIEKEVMDPGRTEKEVAVGSAHLVKLAQDSFGAEIIDESKPKSE
jgi:DNA polymerase-3 subunit gamma/tau